MSKRIFTREQIETLSRNENVRKCSERSISFNKEFKINAIRRYQAGLTCIEVFAEAGFDIRIIGKSSPEDCLKRWKKTYRLKGESGLRIETRGRGGGRPKKVVDTTPADKIKRLEAEVAYLKAENDFLTQLRAKRAERYSGRNKNM